MEVKLFKLMNGMEVVGELLAATGVGYRVKNPLVAQIVQGEGGKPTLAFYEFSMLTPDDDEFQFFDHALMGTPVDPIKEIIDSYIQQHSKILLPPSTSGQILHG